MIIKASKSADTYLNGRYLFFCSNVGFRRCKVDEWMKVSACDTSCRICDVKCGLSPRNTERRHLVIP